MRAIAGPPPSCEMVGRDQNIDKKTVAVFGVGVIGSYLTRFVARMPMVGKIILVDPDRYEKNNLESQNIVPSDIGKLKVDVLNHQLAEINPELEIEVFAERLEDVPVGKLRADLFISCLDSRAARQWVNRLTFGLNIAWVDGGVAAAEQLGRVNCYVPSHQATCYECGFEPEDYTLLEQSYPCLGTPTVPATGTTAELGSLVASLQAFEARKFLCGDLENVLIGRQVVVEVVHHRHFVTAMPRNPNCGFNHRMDPWKIHQISEGSAGLSLRGALALYPTVDHGAPASLYVEGHTFIRRLRCRDCGQKSRLLWRLSHRLEKPDQICSRCQGSMVAGAFDRTGEINESNCQAWIDQPLRKFGFKNGDLITLTGSHNDYHIELGG